MIAADTRSYARAEKVLEEGVGCRVSAKTIERIVGDGLAWNWSIWKKYFRDYTPILDFVHVLSYLFVAAKAVHGDSRDAWDQYVAWMIGCWRGEVEQVLEELGVWRAKLGEPSADAAENDPRRIVAKTIRYLTNNQERMRYPEYRRQGMPVTTAWMESLVKEVGYRVKGTEMFWNNPEGAEAILQVRAASLCLSSPRSLHSATLPLCRLVTSSPITPLLL